jgi:hypothetical protein
MAGIHRLQRTIRRFSLTVLVAAMASAPAAMAQEKHPLMGTWKANLEKSQRHQNHLFSSLTMQFERSGDLVLLTYTGVNMSGKPESSTRKLHPDGKEYPIAEAPGVVEVARWIGTTTLEVVAKKDGKTLGQSTYEVSGDGKTMTTKINAIDASGRPFDQVIVFDHQ